MKPYQKQILTLILACSTITVFGQIRADSLVLYYPFSGNANDYSLSGLDATINGVTLTSDRFGYLNSAYEFDGSNDFIVIPDSNTIQPNFPFSLSVWLKIDQFQPQYALAYWSNDISNIYSGFWLTYSPNGNISAGYGDGLGDQYSNRKSKNTSATMSLNKWHHVVVVFNGLNDIEIYLDGVKRSGSYTGGGTSFSYVSSNGVLGKNYFTNVNQFHDGKIDDVRLYNDALNLKEVNYLFYESPCVNYLTINDTITVFDTNTVVRNIAVTDTLVIDVPLSANSNMYNVVNVYPNPAKDEITLDLGTTYSSMLNYQVRISNAQGQIVFNQLVNNQMMSVNLLNLGSGLYNLYILNTQGTIVANNKLVLY